MNIDEQVELLMQGTEYGDEELKKAMTADKFSKLPLMTIPFLSRLTPISCPGDVIKCHKGRNDHKISPCAARSSFALCRTISDSVTQSLSLCERCG